MIDGLPKNHCFFFSSFNGSVFLANEIVGFISSVVKELTLSRTSPGFYVSAVGMGMSNRLIEYSIERPIIN